MYFLVFWSIFEFIILSLVPILYIQKTDRFMGINDTTICRKFTLRYLVFFIHDRIV